MEEFVPKPLEEDFNNKKKSVFYEICSSFSNYYPSP